MRGGSDAEVAGPGVAGAQGGLEPAFGDTEVVAGGLGGTLWGSRLPERGCRKCAKGFFFFPGTGGETEAGVGLLFGGRTEGAVFSCKSRRCRTARIATSPRRRIASAAVTARRPRCVAGTWWGGIAPRDRTRAERPLWELRGDQNELWPLGASRLLVMIEK